MVFACHMTLQHHGIKGLNDFMVRSSSRYVTTKFDGHRIVIMGIQ